MFFVAVKRIYVVEIRKTNGTFTQLLQFENNVKENKRKVSFIFVFTFLLLFYAQAITFQGQWSTEEK